MDKKTKEAETPEPPIEILGCEIKKKDMPAMYAWAKRNPELLISSVKNMISIDKKELNPERVGSYLAILESDLGTE